MSFITSDSHPNFKTKIFSLTSNKHILLIKGKNQFILRAALILSPRPVKISSLFPLTSLFQSPFKVSFHIPLFKVSNSDCYTCLFFLDMDVSESLTGDFNSILKPSLALHRQKFDLLLKDIASKDIAVSKLTHKELLSFMDGSCTFKKFRQFTYTIQNFNHLFIFKTGCN